MGQEDFREYDSLLKLKSYTLTVHEPFSNIGKALGSSLFLLSFSPSSWAAKETTIPMSTTRSGFMQSALEFKFSLDPLFWYGPTAYPIKLEQTSLLISPKILEIWNCVLNQNFWKYIGFLEESLYKCISSYWCL